MMVTATLMWFVESGRLREPLEYCHLFGEIVPPSKVRIFKSNGISVLLYGSSTWKVTKSITTKLQIFVNRCLRSIFHIYWPNTISNVNLLKMTEMQLIDVTIKSHKWDIPCKKMSLPWLCNGIFWMVLAEEREDPTRREDELWKRSARI